MQVWVVNLLRAVVGGGFRCSSNCHVLFREVLEGDHDHHDVNTGLYWEKGHLQECSRNKTRKCSGLIKVAKVISIEIMQAQVQVEGGSALVASGQRKIP